MNGGMATRSAGVHKDDENLNLKNKTIADLLPDTKKTMDSHDIIRAGGEGIGHSRLNLINPFVHTLNPGTVVDLIQAIVSSFILFPIRILAILILLLLTWGVAIVGLYGMSQEDIVRKPLVGWRKNFQNMARILMRGVFVAGSFHRIKCIGRQASAREAPIVVVAPHSSFFDSLVALITGPPSVVAKAETASLPFFGKLIDFTQPIYVCREDPNSRHTTIQAIKERANSKEDWPPLLIFPEGTCTNRAALISFKLGAFYPGVPIQPIIIRYPNRLDSFTWTWAGPGPMHLLWLTLTKAFSNVEVEFMPVYVPNEEERQNPKLYAKNVQKLMSKALDMPISDYTYNDCKTLARAKEIDLPRFLSVVEVEKLRQTIGLNRTNIEEQIIVGSSLGNDDANYRLKYADFCRQLQIPQDEYSQRLFEIFAAQATPDGRITRTAIEDEMKVDEEVEIDFREYLLFSLFIIKFKQPRAQLVELAFKLYGGAIARETFTRTICRLLGKKRVENAEAATKLFNDIRKGRGASEEEKEEVDGDPKVTFDEFSAYAEQKPKYSYLFAAPKDYAP